MKKILYFPGVYWVVSGDNLENSNKIQLLQKHFQLDLFDYHKLLTPEDINSNYDGLIGSSFGGFFAIYFGLKLNTITFSINPSIELAERFEFLKSLYPGKLDFIDLAYLNQVKNIKNIPEDRFSLINILVNLDDELLNPDKATEFAKKYHSGLFTYHRGGHKADNFAEDMFPLIKEKI